MPGQGRSEVVDWSDGWLVTHEVGNKAKGVITVVLIVNIIVSHPAGSLADRETNTRYR